MLVCSPGIAGYSATGPAKSVDTIACPTAPAGWTKPPDVDSSGQPWGKMVVASAGGNSGTGGDRAQVNCNYYDARGHHVLVVVNLALPSDLNPIANFYFGCSSSVTPWTSRDRMFVATSIDRWAVVALSDPGGFLRPTDVPSFERVARQLLANSEPYAHSCTVEPKPTGVKDEYSFKFSAPGASATGLFWVNATLGSRTSRVVQAEGIEFVARVDAKKTRATLTLDVKHGLTYRLPRPGSPGELLLGVQVAHSTLPSCRRGATGTLTISTAPSVSLQVCSHTYLSGRSSVTISSV
jgi:hypothetical protein